MARKRKPGPRRGPLKQLEDFVTSHPGAEAYLEPQTATMPQSILLVSTDGAWTRLVVPDRDACSSFCRKIGVPVYDAAVVGYPHKHRQAATPTPSAEELAAWFSATTEEEGP